MFGLLERDIMYIRKAISTFPSVEEAIIFGSRAKGNYKKGSDIDLAVKGTNLTEQEVRDIYEKLNEEYPIPYFFDVLHYDTLQNKKLKQHIDQEGEPLPLKTDAFTK
ncbi:nucleotidyltransferase family protein [Alteribacillus bidgolensis]|uniref:Nucleotidyltransferase domain-containing protein n=1 Tax=Alteribacillus bidgolensis TaxID=930129 RepID=A0A1G8QBW7_9BACI|nr:nucleotidyltransferase domain-containing protein [Alteribacillus bidgolensis]SDJ02217.1 Nucleotidyltransferase domain-containing protein [Alteribacillus bidgolensis]